MDAMIKSRVPVTQPLGKQAFHEHTGWDCSGDNVWATLISLSTLENIEQWQLGKEWIRMKARSQLGCSGRMAWTPVFPELSMIPLG